MIYEVDLSLPEVHLNFRLLFRGTWDRTPEELEYQTCRDMCNYFKRAGTVSIHMVHARPRYLGCYLEPNKNDENVNDLVYPPELDFTRYALPTTTSTTSTTTTTTTTYQSTSTSSLTTTRPPAHANDDDGRGIGTQWIVFGILMAFALFRVLNSCIAYSVAQDAAPALHPGP